MSQIINEDMKSTQLTELIKKIYEVSREKRFEEVWSRLKDILYAANRNVDYKALGQQDDVDKFLNYIATDVYDCRNCPTLKDYIKDQNIYSTEKLDQMVENGIYIDLLKKQYEEKYSRTVSDEAVSKIKDYFKELYQKYSKNCYDYGQLNRSRDNDGQRTLANIRKEFARFGLDDVTDDQIHIITDMSQFKRKSRGQYGYCIAMSNGYPKYICYFEDNGAIGGIQDISGHYRGRSRADQVIRWAEVESYCDSIMVFDNIWDKEQASNEIRNNREGNTSYYADGWRHEGYKSGVHGLSDQERKDRIEAIRRAKEEQIRNNRKEIIKSRTNVVKYDEQLVKLNDALNDLRYKTTELYDSIKQEDLFSDEDMQTDKGAKIKLVFDCVTCYKTSKQVYNRFSNKEADQYSNSSDYEIRQIESTISTVNSFITKLDEASNL